MPGNRQGAIDYFFIFYNLICFLGDSVYPLMTFLLKPILNAPIGSPEYRYTQHITTARSAVERCIGILKGRWRCLRKERALHYQPEFAFIKHNFLHKKTMFLFIV